MSAVAVLLVGGEVIIGQLYQAWLICKLGKQRIGENLRGGAGCTAIDSSKQSVNRAVKEKSWNEIHEILPLLHFAPNLFQLGVHAPIFRSDKMNTICPY